jgi:hypothetical protein
VNFGSARGEEVSGGKVLRLIRIRLATPSLAKITPACQDDLRIADSSSRKRSQLHIRAHNETLSIAAMASAIQIVRLLE